MRSFESRYYKWLVWLTAGVPAVIGLIVFTGWVCGIEALVKPGMGMVLLTIACSLVMAIMLCQSAITIGKRAAAEREALEGLQQSLSRFELLSETAGELLRSKEPQKVVDRLCRRVMEHLDCQAFFNFLVDEKAGRLHLNACAGVPAEDVKKIEWLDYGVAVCGCVAQCGERIIAEHISTTPDIRTELVKSYGIRAYCCHPLPGPGGKVIGTLSFGTKTRDCFSKDEISVMKAVVDHVAVAMVRMQNEMEIAEAKERLEERVKERTIQLEKLFEDLTNTEVRERQRLAGMLHDNLQQLLAAAKLKIDMLRMLISDDELVQRIRESSANIKEAIDYSRSMAVELVPPVLYDSGLGDAINWLADWMGQRHELNVKAVVDKETEPTNKDVRVFMFQAARELLFNVRKHAGVYDAEVRLSAVNGDIVLEVIDEGAGVSEDRIAVLLKTADHFGLASIQERTTMLGGKMRITARQGSGMRVSISLPKHTKT